MCVWGTHARLRRGWGQLRDLCRRRGLGNPSVDKWVEIQLVVGRLAQQAAAQEGRSRVLRAVGQVQIECGQWSAYRYHCDRWNTHTARRATVESLERALGVPPWHLGLNPTASRISMRRTSLQAPKEYRRT